MAYVHLQKLGTPKEGRLAARSGQAAEMLRIYERHLAKPEAQHELEELTALARSGRPICLLCYERDPRHCHRQRLAELVCERTGIGVQHLAATFSRGGGGGGGGGGVLLAQTLQLRLRHDAFDEPARAFFRRRLKQFHRLVTVALDQRIFAAIEIRLASTRFLTAWGSRRQPATSTPSAFNSPTNMCSTGAGHPAHIHVLETLYTHREHTLLLRAPFGDFVPGSARRHSSGQRPLLDAYRRAAFAVAPLGKQRAPRAMRAFHIAAIIAQCHIVIAMADQFRRPCAALRIRAVEVS